MDVWEAVAVFRWEKTDRCYRDSGDGEKLVDQVNGVLWWTRYRVILTGSQLFFLHLLFSVYESFRGHCKTIHLSVVFLQRILIAHFLHMVFSYYLEFPLFSIYFQIISILMRCLSPSSFINNHPIFVEHLLYSRHCFRDTVVSKNYSLT